MPHPLATFLNERMNDLGMTQADVARASGLSRALVSKHLGDQRDQFSRLPDRRTLLGFATALHVPLEVLLARSIESLGGGYMVGDFVNSVATASDFELLRELERRLEERGPGLRVIRPEKDEGAPKDDAVPSQPGFGAQRVRISSQSLKRSVVDEGIKEVEAELERQSDLQARRAARKQYQPRPGD